MIWGRDHLCPGERLTELGLFSVKRRHREGTKAGKVMLSIYRGSVPQFPQEELGWEAVLETLNAACCNSLSFPGFLEGQGQGRRLDGWPWALKLVG